MGRAAAFVGEKFNFAMSPKSGPARPSPPPSMKLACPLLWYNMIQVKGYAYADYPER
jgi:hypothetical protein